MINNAKQVGESILKSPVFDSDKQVLALVSNAQPPESNRSFSCNWFRLALKGAWKLTGDG